MLNVAVVGAGNIGSKRARVVQASAAARLSVVADLDLQRAELVACPAAANFTSNWRDAIEAPEVDVVVVSTPTKFHAEAVELALLAGKHVLCEKPLARSAAEAERMVALTERHHLVLKTGFNYRYMRHVMAAKDLAANGEIGPLYFLRCRYGHGGRVGYENYWCTDQDLAGGGALLEQGIHILDLSRYLLGEPDRVVASAPRFFWNFPAVEDNCFVQLETVSGQTAQIHVSWTQWLNIFSLELFGRDGYLHLTGRDGHYGPQRLVLGRRKPDHSRPDETTLEFPMEDDSWHREWEEFLGAVRTGSPFMGTTGDSLRALEMVEAAYESSHKRRWIELPVVPRSEKAVLPALTGAQVTSPL